MRGPPPRQATSSQVRIFMSLSKGRFNSRCTESGAETARLVRPSRPQSHMLAYKDLTRRRDTETRLSPLTSVLPRCCPKRPRGIFFGGAKDWCWPRPALKADGRVLIKDRFGCICEHGCEHGPLPASGSLSPSGVGGHIPRLLGSSLNMPEANRETRHGVAFDRDETKDRPRR